MKLAAQDWSADIPTFQYPQALHVKHPSIRTESVPVVAHHGGPLALARSEWHTTMSFLDRPGPHTNESARLVSTTQSEDYLPLACRWR